MQSEIQGREAIVTWGREHKRRFKNDWKRPQAHRVEGRGTCLREKAANGGASGYEVSALKILPGSDVRAKKKLLEPLWGVRARQQLAKDPRRRWGQVYREAWVSKAAWEARPLWYPIKDSEASHWTWRFSETFQAQAERYQWTFRKLNKDFDRDEERCTGQRGRLLGDERLYSAMYGGNAQVPSPVQTTAIHLRQPDSLQRQHLEIVHSNWQRREGA